MVSVSEYGQEDRNIDKLGRLCQIITVWQWGDNGHTLSRNIMEYYAYN